MRIIVKFAAQGIRHNDISGNASALQPPVKRLVTNIQIRETCSPMRTGRLYSRCAPQHLAGLVDMHFMTGRVKAMMGIRVPKDLCIREGSTYQDATNQILGNISLIGTLSCEVDPYLYHATQDHIEFDRLQARTITGSVPLPTPKNIASMKPRTPVYAHIRFRTSASRTEISAPMPLACWSDRSSSSSSSNSNPTKVYLNLIASSFTHGS